MNFKKKVREKKIQRLIGRLNQKLDRLNQQSRHCFVSRIISFSGSLFLVWMVGFLEATPLKIIIPSIGFLIFFLVLAKHYHIRYQIKNYLAWLKIKSGQIAEMRMDWKYLFSREYTEPITAHPTDLDLNISGAKSLHRLMDFSISKEGSRQLYEWLMNENPDLEDLKLRQKIVKEMVVNARFRDRFLWNYFKTTDNRINGLSLLNLFEQKLQSGVLKWYVISSFVCYGLFWLLFILKAFMVLPTYLPVLCLTVNAIIYSISINKRESIITDAQTLDDELTKLKIVFRFLEGYEYQKMPETKAFCHYFNEDPDRPTNDLRKIKWYSAAIGFSMNPIMKVFLNLIMPWEITLTYLIEQEKGSLKKKFPLWMAKLSEIEGLISLANFAYLNPHYTFPSFSNTSQTAEILKVKAIGHPLISHEKKVRNDFSFRNKGDVGIITGSNMTGKSTFLKTLGINLRLAYSGGPVDAMEMSTGLFRLMTSIRISDSLSEEMSYFYVEVKYLKKILFSLKSEKHLPVFFLIDEIFKGTNNLERYYGSRPYIKAVSNKNGVGIITTHDLKLCKLSDDASSILNYHFGDSVDSGKFLFDYKLKEGPCTSTNALEIIKSEGLPVDAVPADKLDSTDI